MIKRAVYSVVILFSWIFIFASFVTNTYSQPITLSDRKVIYDLPFAGILPDSPLYPVKQIRDIIIEFITRDYIKKSELLLVSSDKKINMALQLSKKGKVKLMLETLEAAEKQAGSIPDLITESHKQGVSPYEGFTLRLKLSNVKHREVIEQLIEELPQGQEQNINTALELNAETKRKLDLL